jgi:5'-3' exonuclease
MNIKEKELNTLKQIIDLKVLNQTENGKTELQGISPKTKT